MNTAAGRREGERGNDHALVGTAAHELAATCLEQDDEPWEYIGGTVNGIDVDKDMADAVTVYVNYIRDRFPNPEQDWVETFFHRPDLHEHYAGTADYSAVQKRTLSVVDYKHGQGVVVEAKDNVQLRYYACGVLQTFDLWDKVDTVFGVIVQPRAFHSAGPIRPDSWDVQELQQWLVETLLPGMEEAMTSTETVAGPHCQFCPALGRKCPALMKVTARMKRLMKKMETKGAAALTSTELADVLNLGVPFKMHHAAAQKVAQARLEKGSEVGKGDGAWKLVRKRGNRVWKEGAEAAAREEFGDDAFTKPKLLTPAQLSKLPQGSKFATKHAHSPDVGHTLAPAKDSRREQGPRQKSMFTPVAKGD